MSNKTESISMNLFTFHLSAFEHALLFKKKKIFICSARETLTDSLKCVDYLWYIAMLWSTVTI